MPSSSSLGGPSSRACSSCHAAGAQHAAAWGLTLLTMALSYFSVVVLNSSTHLHPCASQSMHKALPADPRALTGAKSSPPSPLQESPALLQADTTLGSHPDHHCGHVLRPDHRVQRQLQGLLDDLGVCGKGERPQQVVLLTGIRSLQWYKGEVLLANRQQGNGQTVGLGMPCSGETASSRGQTSCRPQPRHAMHCVEEKSS